MMCSSSIMAHHHAVSPGDRQIEIQGFYWPRLLLRNSKVMSPVGKKDEKKVHKAKHQKPKNYRPVSPPIQKMPSSPPPSASTTSLLELLHDVPALISEDHSRSRSPITGKPILSPRSNSSILIPTKPVRRQLERRSQSSDTAFTLD
mmetsp:Transcript_36634/g.104257  ORF Transcript_36634/g.104257 Transcript_36634/m.104257 type:complete len:146 (+) Transcript_36634:2-439(+)